MKIRTNLNYFERFIVVEIFCNKLRDSEKLRGNLDLFIK